MKIVQIGDPILEQKAEGVENVKDPEIQELIDSMVSYVEKDEESVGLAAPQVGKGVAICIVKRFDIQITEEGEKTVGEVIPLINPKLLWNSRDTSIFWEGCLSVGEGDERLFSPVERPEKVRIEYLDKEGNKQQLEAEDFFSHVVQHELDHLEGTLFITYIKDPQNIWKSKDLDAYMEEHKELPPVNGFDDEVSDLIVD